MWCYLGGGSKPILIYEYQPTRGGYHAKNFLTGFKGYLQSDAYSGYNFADRNQAIVKVGCMAHARRKFADIIKIAKTNGLAHEAIRFFKSLYKIEKEASDLTLLDWTPNLINLADQTRCYHDSKIRQSIQSRSH